MEAVLHSLARILLNALPTFFLVLFLYAYLRFMFFKPLDALFAGRFSSTGGARKAAEESMRQADARVAEYEEAIRAARRDVYREQEQQRRIVQEEHGKRVESARRSAEERLKRAEAEIGAEAASARNSLRQESDALADQIAESLLRGRVA